MKGYGGAFQRNPVELFPFIACVCVREILQVILSALVCGFIQYVIFRKPVGAGLLWNPGGFLSSLHPTFHNDHVYQAKDSSRGLLIVTHTNASVSKIER